MNHVTQLWCFINHLTLCLSRKTDANQWFCSNTSKEVLKMGQFSTHNNLVQSSVLKNNNIIHKTNARLLFAADYGPFLLLMEISI